MFPSHSKARICWRPFNRRGGSDDEMKARLDFSRVVTLSIRVILLLSLTEVNDPLSSRRWTVR